MRGEAEAGGKREDSRYKNSLRRREHERRGCSWGKEKRIVDIRMASGEGNMRGVAVAMGKRRG
jgi:hypothetical protein